MLYIDYEIYKMRFYEAQRAYESILTEKESLFQMTQPKGVSMKKDKVQVSPSNTLFDDYLVAKEKALIDERLEEAKKMVSDRMELLKQKEDELRRSPDPMDRIYVMRYLDRRKVREISRMVIYSEPQVYRILKRIRITIEEAKEDDRK